MKAHKSKFAVERRLALTGDKYVKERKLNKKLKAQNLKLGVELAAAKREKAHAVKRMKAAASRFQSMLGAQQDKKFRDLNANGAGGVASAKEWACKNESCAQLNHRSIW